MGRRCLKTQYKNRSERRPEAYEGGSGSLLEIIDELREIIQRMTDMIRKQEDLIEKNKCTDSTQDKKSLREERENIDNALDIIEMKLRGI